jgi:uridylate kinase
MKIVVSIGGSVLVPDVDPDRVAAYADVLERLVEAGHELAVVVGGGPAAREYISTARELGANEIELDHLGIAVTRLNARLLIAALDDRAAPTPSEDYDSARAALRRGDVPVMGGTDPGHTTDAVGTALAEYTEADVLVYATSVPGVYDADPNQSPDATKYDEIQASELVSLIGSLEMEAGSNAPVDLLAAKLLDRAGLRAAVVDGTDPQAVLAAVEGDHDGTDIIPTHD